MENSEFYLGVETSGHSGSIAITGPGQQTAQIDLQQQGRKHAQTLVAEVKKLLEQLELAPVQIRGVGVSRGPGSFTGLRIGTTFAKTFAYATGCPVLGIDTFEAIALNCPLAIQEISVISNAQRGDLFVGKYVRISDDQWECTAEIDVCEITDFCRSLTPGDTVTGPGMELLEPSTLSDIRLLEPELRFPVAAKIAEMTARILQNRPPAHHESLNEVWNLTPFYLRKSAAEEKWDALQQNQTD
ncbi:MAG: tRNA (adenosine(37)-N6)-threonylcarbamoyltransferase complex dimerization subunit type 1 TsaB [Planctomycetaceae bacterium]|nr:tRNA (adenosine(37)-N6)-threonylcarbamoyltransferase complex dimerization subunit type 1 TsaB [Planctomycetaceae bacterium]